MKRLFLLLPFLIPLLLVLSASAELPLAPSSLPETFVVASNVKYESQVAILAAPDAQGTPEDELVKYLVIRNIFHEDYYSWVTQIQCEVTSRVPDPRKVNISPLVPDPLQVTSRPWKLDGECPVTFRPSPDPIWTEQVGVSLLFKFNSLMDLGLWTITCTGESIDPNSIVLTDDPIDPCGGLIYPASAGIPWTQPLVFNLRVYNDAPSASISHSPTPTWNKTVTLKANALDPDNATVADTNTSSKFELPDQGLLYRWSILSKPTHATAHLANNQKAAPVITFSGDQDIGTWLFQLELTDNEGESKIFKYPLTVPNEPPTSTGITLSPMPAWDQTVTLHSNAKDPDGGSLTYHWTIQQQPTRSTTVLIDPNSADPKLPFSSDHDIGTWTIALDVSDNEGEHKTFTKTFIVPNAPPDIQLQGTETIQVGQGIDVHTTVLEDDDGGDLAFRWDIIQAPLSSSRTVQEGYASGTGTEGASLVTDTTPGDAGTWIFRLVATDDDKAPDSELSKEFTVLVDAPPVAAINAEPVQETGQPIILNGNDSVDPDSPCPEEPKRCHVTLDGRPVSISPGLSYSWFLVDTPPEFMDSYQLGAVDDVFGIFAHGEKLAFPSHALGPGKWLFRLEVEDGEGSTDATEAQISLIDRSSPPRAFISPRVDMS